MQWSWTNCLTVFIDGPNMISRNINKKNNNNNIKYARAITFWDGVILEFYLSAIIAHQDKYIILFRAIIKHSIDSNLLYESLPSVVWFDCRNQPHALQRWATFFKPNLISFRSDELIPNFWLSNITIRWWKMRMHWIQFRS